MREAYYNEFDPKAAAWLRELIDKGHIAKGIVDERSISDVTPGDLEGYIQCHFFAGIGVWSKALRDAGWPDDRPVWTGSCPCQPFSAAGKGIGFADERHLWPAWHWLIDQCRPDTIFGEQVASKDGLNWFDLVSSDLEGSSYTVGASDLCAAGFGAPHIRQRLYFVAHAAGSRHQPREGDAGIRDADLGAAAAAVERGPLRPSSELEHATGDGRLEWRAGADGRGAASDDAGLEGRGQPGRERAAERLAGPDGVAGGLGYAASAGSLPSPHGSLHRGEEGARPRDAERERPGSVGRVADAHDAGRVEGHGQPERDCSDHRPGPTNGHWRDADWLHGRDGKWRPVEPGTFPLAHGSPARVGRLRGYGNAIVKDAAQAFIEECMRCF